MEDTASPIAGDDPRRRYYRITPTGAARLSTEADRMAATVRIAIQRRVIPAPSMS